jgi:halogenation protein CepH
VAYIDNAGHQRQARAQYVVDASGHSGCFGSVIGKREFSTFFRKLAVFGYFDNGGRLGFPIDGNVLFQTYQDAWMWYIPLNDRLTSVGAVLPARQARLVQAGPQKALEFYIAHCPLIREFLKGATMSQERPFNTIRTRSEYSYCQTHFWMPGGILIGDAACFVDVLLSSGVHLATYAALLAARSINSILHTGLGEALCLNEFEARLRVEYAIFYQGLVGLYDMHQESTAYTNWLRALLQQSNGVYIEAPPACPTPSAQTHPDGSVAVRQSADNVATLRQYNAQQIRYNGAPGMRIEAPLPHLHHTLTPSSDQLYWLNRTAHG